MRYNANGTSDNTFGSNGALTYNDTVDGSDIGNDVAVQPDGKIVVVGERMEGTKDDLLVIRISGGPTGQHSLSINKSGSGSGTIISSETPAPLINCGAQCSAPYGSGVTVTLTAIADESSTFTGWPGSGCSGSGPCLITMDSEKAVTATFESKTFTVTPSGGINGALAPVAPQTVNYGEAISFVITPNAGYHIASVEGCGGSLAGNIYTTGAIRADCTITAAFSISDISVHVSTSKGRLLGGLKVYAFTGAGSYTGTSATTGADGNATFKPETFSSGSYKFRLDYMGYQFWSATLNMTFNPVIDIVVQEETAEVSLNPALPGVKVYLFTSGGSYLSQNATTSTSGKVSFDLPVGKDFKFRADNLGYQYWSPATTIAGGGTNLIPINIGGDAFRVTVQKGPGSPISGVKTYLFNQSGTYLGLTQTTDSAGLVKYDVTSGTFKLRADYMGYQFWSAATSVTADTSIALDIPHRSDTVTVNGMFQGAATAIPGIPVYVYNLSDTYLSLNRTTDGSGKVSFELPGETYKVRADYLGAQFWSQGFISQDVTVNIPMADAKITVIGNGSPLVGVPVYVFTSSGSYLGISGTTNSTGQKTFRLPAGAYKFRADYEGKQFWSPQENLTADVENTIMISTGGGSFALRVLKAANTPLSGIKCYVFNEGGPYLNMSGVTDAQGEVTFNLADGHYQFRIDYLGHQFWTDIVGVPAILNLTETINHRDTKVTTEGQLGVDMRPLAGIPVSLFTPTGSYLGLQQTSDANGSAVFSLPEKPYMVRADTLGQQFWSSEFTWQDTAVNISEGIARVHVGMAGQDIAAVKVYVFDSAGTYLGLSGSTNSAGLIDFRLPEGSYKFRATYQGLQFWASAGVVRDIVNPVGIDSAGAEVTVSVDNGSGPMSGIPVYVFTSGDTYLGISGTTSASGSVSFRLVGGSFKFRVDYLGYQYWTNVISVPAETNVPLSIPHKNLTISVNGLLSGHVEPISRIPVYLFTPAGSYLSIQRTTDSNGQTVMYLPDEQYKVRADYLGEQFWSDIFQYTDTAVSVNQGIVRMQINRGGIGLSGVKVYLFSPGGSYLGSFTSTNATGTAEFILPDRIFNFRIDNSGYQYWSGAVDVLSGQVNEIIMDLDLYAP